MNTKLSTFALAAGLMLAAAQAGATTINFDDLADGDILSTQYAALGVTFSANALSGPNINSSPQDWASNTDMSIASIALGNVGGMSTPALASGNVLHGFNGWFDEDGDASFRISFATPINFFSAVFAGVGTPADSAIYAYNGNTLLGTVAGTTVGQFVLSYSAASITSVVVAPGSFGDWVAIDNVIFTPVPEPTSYALMALGLGALALKRRRR